MTEKLEQYIRFDCILQTRGLYSQKYVITSARFGNNYKVYPDTISKLFSPVYSRKPKALNSKP